MIELFKALYSLSKENGKTPPEEVDAMTVYQLNQMPRFAKMLKEFRRSRTDFKIPIYKNRNTIVCISYVNIVEIYRLLRNKILNL